MPGSTIASFEHMLILALTFFIPPVFGLVILIVILATVGKSLGIRQAYVGLLLKIFKWASGRIEKARALTENDRELLESDQEYESSVTAPEPRRSPPTNFIQKDATLRIMRTISVAEPDKQKTFVFIADSLEFVKAGVESIIEDEVTSRFSAEELTGWNLLSRSSLGYQYGSLRLTVLWCLGFVLRYLVLLPIRLIILFIGLCFLIVATAFVGYVPDRDENMARSGGICVANHTSPIDVMILSCDNCYALVGQKHGGLLGVIQRALNRASSHIWFERAEVNDRAAVGRRLRDHVEDKHKLPILIFPEGTCINNTSVMMFKKGSFEVGGVIYPAAIKYDARFGDAFWNSSQQSYIQYLAMMMTSWAIVVDVRYLPPMTRQEGEGAAEFAARVKKAIAEAGGLVDLEWDGQLKRHRVKKEMLEQQQERYSRRFRGSGVSLDELSPSDVDSIVQAARASPMFEALVNGLSSDDERSSGVFDMNQSNPYNEQPPSPSEQPAKHFESGLVKRYKAFFESRSNSQGLEE